MTLSVLAVNDQSPTHLTIHEAMKFSGYSDQYIRRLAREGRIRGLKIAHIWIIELASLTQYLASIQETQAGDARFGPHRPAQEVQSGPAGNGGL